jgi:uridine kinase
VLYDQKLTDLLDLKIFIDAKDHIKLKRRIIRDKEERGYDLDDVLYRYERHVIPTYEKYILPYIHDSDLVIPNNNNFDNALEVLVTFLKSKV